jgi:hypothetical protein
LLVDEPAVKVGHRHVAVVVGDGGEDLDRLLAAAQLRDEDLELVKVELIVAVDIDALELALDLFGRQLNAELAEHALDLVKLELARLVLIGTSKLVQHNHIHL